MADVDDPAKKTAAAIVGRVPSKKDDRNPLFTLASKHLISLASEYCSLIKSLVFGIVSLLDKFKKTKTASAAAAIVGSVDDLLLEIFQFVPSENDDRTPQFKLGSKHLNSIATYYYPLTRLRLVSRHWNSLISNNFPRNPKPTPASGLIFVCPSYQCATAHSYTLYLDQTISTHVPFRKIDEPWLGRSNKVVHSCNGLLLCARQRMRAPRQVYYVCNPTTGKHSILPRVPPSVNNMTIRGVYLAFDPCKSPHYKVVCVLGFEDDDHSQFMVYSSQTGCWGKCGDMFETNNVRFGNGVFWNGAIHWLGSSKLFCFNPGDDREDRLPAPEVWPMPIARDHDRRYYFGESYGHLHYVCLDYGPFELVVHEMMSGDYSAGWVVKYKFDFNHVFHNYDVFAVVRGERDEDTYLVLGTFRRWRGMKIIVRFNL